jgi:ribosomal-protein-alanine N-acetyltransferase
MSAIQTQFSLTTQLQLRPMQTADLDAIEVIEPQIYSHPWTRGNFSDSLNAGYSCWVYEDGGAIFGYAVLMTVLDEAHLLNISIAKSHQGQSLGRKLLEHMMQIARNHGAENIFLEVRPSNTAAVRLYESMGFNEMAIRRNYYPAIVGREDAILMGMSLKAVP